MHFTSTFGLLASLLVVAVQGIDPSWPKDAITHCRNGHAAMSFDDGPTPLTRSIVDQLVAAKQHATFFVNVNNYGKTREASSTLILLAKTYLPLLL